MSSIIPKLPADLSKRLSGELAPGERLLYAAKPDWRAEWGKLIVIALFGLGWMSICGPMAMFTWAEALGFPVTKPGKGMGQGMSIFFSLFMIPFVLVGLGMLVAPFLSIRKSRNTAHAVTDARVLNIYGGKDAGVESYKLSAINFVKRRDRRDGSGSLEIGYGVEKDSDGDTRPLTIEWTGIPDAKRAEAIIRDQAKWVR